jgi:anti-sigma B factor antagonist
MADAAGASNNQSGASNNQSSVETPLAVEGEIDIASAPRMAADLTAYAERVSGDVVVDCSKMTFIDSSGLAVLETARRDLVAQGRRLVLRDVAKQCRRAFEIIGLGELLESPG